MMHRHHRTAALFVGAVVVVSLMVRGVASQSAAPAADALLAAALKRAQAERKAVFVDFGASWCGPCLALHAMFEAAETRKPFADHYVLLKLTVSEHGDKVPLNNPGAEELMTKWGGRTAIPFYAILDARGKKLSSGTGYPGDSAGIKEFVALVDATAPRMPATDRAALLNYLYAHSNGLGTIAGRVLDGAGRPVVRASVSVVERRYVDGQWTPVRGRTANADAQGRYVVENVIAGDYWVVVEAQSPARGSVQQTTFPFAPTLFPSAMRLGDASRVTLQGGHGITSIDLSPNQVSPVRVSGVITASNGTPSANASVTLTNVEWPLGTSTTSGRDGAFSVPSVWPGRYTLWARGAPGPSATGRIAETGSLSVVVSGSDLTTVTVATSRGATLSGTVVFEGQPMRTVDREPIRITAVAVEPSPGAPRGLSQSRLAGDGGFEIAGLFGARALRVAGLPTGWMLKSISRGGVDVTDTPVDVAGTARLDGFQVVVTNRVSEVTGTVTNANRQLVKGGAVLLFAADASRWKYPSRFVRSAPIQDNGAFRIAALPPGSYLVAPVQSLQSNWDAPELLKPLRDRATAVRLAEGERKVVTVTMHPREQK